MEWLVKRFMMKHSVVRKNNLMYTQQYLMYYTRSKDYSDEGLKFIRKFNLKRSF